MIDSTLKQIIHFIGTSHTSDVGDQQARHHIWSSPI